MFEYIFNKFVVYFLGSSFSAFVNSVEGRLGCIILRMVGVGCVILKLTAGRWLSLTLVSGQIVFVLNDIDYDGLFILT